MRSLLLVLTVLWLAACAAPSGLTAGAPTSPTPTVAQVIRISPAQAKAVADGRRGVIIDVRTTAEFEQRRIAGAIHAPLEAIQANPRLPVLAAIPADQELILYCT